MKTPEEVRKIEVQLEAALKSIRRIREYARDMLNGIERIVIEGISDGVLESLSEHESWKSIAIGYCVEHGKAAGGECACDLCEKVERKD